MQIIGVGQGLRSRALSNVKTCQKVWTDEIILRNHKADNLQDKNWKIPTNKGEIPPNSRRALLENGRPWHLSMFSIMLSKYTSKSLASLARTVWRTLESKQI
jgi:hypothetical protein